MYVWFGGDMKKFFLWIWFLCADFLLPLLHSAMLLCQEFYVHTFGYVQRHVSRSLDCHTTTSESQHTTHSLSLNARTPDQQRQRQQQQQQKAIYVVIECIGRSHSLLKMKNTYLHGIRVVKKSIWYPCKLNWVRKILMVRSHCTYSSYIHIYNTCLVFCSGTVIRICGIYWKSTSPAIFHVSLYGYISL